MNLSFSFGDGGANNFRVTLVFSGAFKEGWGGERSQYSSLSEICYGPFLQTELDMPLLEFCLDNLFLLPQQMTNVRAVTKVIQRNSCRVRVYILMPCVCVELLRGVLAPWLLRSNAVDAFPFG